MTWTFAAIGLTLALAAFVSPFAASSPDGLERVAADHGFLAQSEQRAPAWRHAPLAEYLLPGVANAKVATGLAGVLGTLAVLGAGWGLARFAGVNGGRRKDSAVAGSSGERP